MSIATISKTWICQSLQDLHQVAQEIIDFAITQQQHVWILEGDLGAGKTTFVKAVCEVLGVDEIVNSPTFALINEYQTTTKKLIYHCDFYRLNNPSEVVEIGFDDYIESEAYCFIEWASKIEPFLPEHYLEITISVDELTNSRTLIVHSV